MLMGTEIFQTNQVFKTHLNFIPRAIVEGVMAISNINVFFFGNPVYVIKM